MSVSVYLCMFVCRMMMVRDESMDGWMEYCIRFLSTYSCCWVHVYFLHVVVSRVLVGSCRWRKCGTRWHSVKREVWKINPLMKLGQELKKHKSQGQI